MNRIERFIVRRISGLFNGKQSVRKDFGLDFFLLPFYIYYFHKWSKESDKDTKEDML